RPPSNSTLFPYTTLFRSFIPDQDNDSLNISMLAAQGTSFDDMAASARRVADIINRNPYVDTFFVSTGGGFGAMNTTRFNVQLVRSEEHTSELQSPYDLVC